MAIDAFVEEEGHDADCGSTGVATGAAGLTSRSLRLALAIRFSSARSARASLRSLAFGELARRSRFLARRSLLRFVMKNRSAYLPASFLPLRPCALVAMVVSLAKFFASLLFDGCG